MDRPRTHAAVAILFLAAVMISSGATPASAAGNATLAGYIITNPVPDVVPAAQAPVDTIASQLQAEENVAIKGTGATATVAAEGWHRRGSPTTSLLIYLIAISEPGKSMSVLTASADEAAAAAAASFCSGASASLPIISRSVPHLPDSHYVLCKRSPNGTNAEGITAARANVTALIASGEQIIDRASLESVALRQYRAMS
jgi:hypothetical protein